MLLVGLTGGIGSGKSTVALMLEARGAVVFDADEMAHDAIAPGTAGHDAVAERFGAHILAPGGDIDREALGAVVFVDLAARRDLEAIVHPEVFRLLNRGMESYRDTNRIVVFDAPLIIETGFHTSCDVVVVVSAPAEKQVARMAADRGMSGVEVRRRIAAQLPTEEKAAVADVLLDNDGTVEELEAQVDRLWSGLEARARRGSAG